MSVFVPTDMYNHDIHVSQAHGGCGEVHHIGDDGIVDCDFCVPFLVRFHGAAAAKEMVALTPDEKRNENRLSAEGAKNAQAITEAFAKIAAGALVDANHESAVAAKGAARRTTRSKAAAEGVSI